MRPAPTRSTTSAWRRGGFYEFSKRQPQYFALVFLDRRVPRIARESEQLRVHGGDQERDPHPHAALHRRGTVPGVARRRRRLAPDPGAGIRPGAAAAVRPPAAARGRGRAGARRHRDDDCRPACRRAPRTRAAPCRRRSTARPPFIRARRPRESARLPSQSPPCRRRPRGCALDCRGRLWRQRLAGRGAGRVEARTGARRDRAAPNRNRSRAS